MLLFAVSIFAGAFLLFQVQPLIAGYILPWFGGTPAVWTTALLFFQMLLLGGYAYAHLSIRRLRPRGQAVLHLAVLLAAVALLPITPAEHWKPDSANAPTWQILLLLTANIGLPFFVLASTSPLLQAWISRLRAGASPYRLYSLSNVGSLIALVSYPFLVEPVFTRTTQANIWSGGFVLFAVFAGACAVSVWRDQPDPRGPGRVETPVDSAARPPNLLTRALWLGLPAAASVLLLAITNQLSQEVAAIPFLWVLPLSLYLLSFIITFDREKWYYRPVVTSALIPALAAVVWILFQEGEASLLLQVGGYSLALFICAMTCHGELARLKPHPRYLTAYYLTIAGGGALGGISVGLVAPVIFDLFVELHLGLLACAALVLIALATDPKSALYRNRPRWAWISLSTAYLGLAVALMIQVRQSFQAVVTNSRTFYGVLTVQRYDPDTAFEIFRLRHGSTVHGAQYLASDKRRWPTTYYGPLSGAGLALRNFKRDAERRIGIVGLGVGTLTTYGRVGDYFRIYEINPDVQRIADTYFRYLTDADAQVDVVLGDARLSMEREAPQAFDILVLDAFASDAVPVHLLTKEAFEIYLRHLKPDGVIAVHLSSRYFNLEPVIRRLAEHFDLGAAFVASPGGSAAFPASWELLTNNREFLNGELVQEAAGPVPTIQRRVRLWTDDHSSLFTLWALSRQ